MKQRTNGRGFRPPSRDPRQISERSLVCESPPSQFIFAKMTIGLEGCYARIRCEDESTNISVLEKQAIKEEEFSPKPGSILAGRYNVIAKVGEGQSSVLVKAEDIFHPNKKLVAIKILHASYYNLGPQEASCLLHLRKADTLKVANIAHMLNTFTVGQHFCIVFEFLLPTPLYKYFQMFPFPSKAEKIKLIRRIAFQITQSLAVLSSLNIIHSDIKPENILFTDGVKKDVKLIDFGNAIYCIHDEMSLYFESFELQTVFYRAPEVMFGLPFGPQIDMWSLGCVLAEFYLGEPLFLATSKDEILEKMQTLLGPLPMSPFQSGKYFSMFKKFVGRVSSVPGDSKIVVNILKKLGSTDYIFADFLAKLLVFDPSLRLSPTEAARHPFLAPECAMIFMLPSRDLTQEHTYPPILFTPATYPHRPKIDAKIKKLHYSELDLLRVGTQASKISKADTCNVMKVLPFNYQEETPNINKEEKRLVTNKSKPEPRKSNNVGKNTKEKFCNNETAGVFGVRIENKNHQGDRFSVDKDRRDNPYNESCCVLRPTKDARSICVKENETYNDHNLVKNSKLLQGSAIRGQKDNTPGANTTNETCSLFSKHIEKDNTFDPIESCSGSNAIKNSSFFTTSVKGGLTGDEDDETCKVLNAAKDKRLSALFAKQHERDGPFNESCSVLNTKNSHPLTVHKEKGKNKKHARKFVLRKSSNTRRRGDSETESGSSVSREENTNIRKPYNAQSVSPAKVGDTHDNSPLKFINENELMVLVTATSTRTTSTRTTSKHDDRILEDIQRSENRVSPTIAYKESSSETSYKETRAATPPTRRTSKLDDKILENIPKRFTNRKMDEVNMIVSPNATNKGTWWKTGDKETPRTRRSASRQNKTVKSSISYADENGGKSGNKACVSTTKDRPNPSSAVGRRKNTITQQVVSSGVKDGPQAEPTLTHETREDVSTTCSNYKDNFSVTSSSKQASVDSCLNAKIPESTQPSFLKSFFDGFAEDKTNVVSSSTNVGELRAKTKGISKKNVQSFSKEKNSSFDEDFMLVTSSNKQDKRLARKRNIDMNSATAKRNNESEIVTSSINQGNGTSLKHTTKPRTPNFQKKESVFDTPIPCNVVSSKRELLPGGLSEVKKTMSRSEMEQVNSLYENHHSFQTQVVSDAETFSEDKQSLDKFRKTYTSPKERTKKVFLERNNQLVRDGQLLKNESQDLKRVSKEKGDRNLPKRPGVFYPTDILTQQTVKQARKRKLEYSTANSPGKSNTVSCLEMDRQTVKVQKIDELSDDCDDNYDVLLLQYKDA